jgi:hypothetical protein
MRFAVLVLALAPAHAAAQEANYVPEKPFAAACVTRPEIARGDAPARLRPHSLTREPGATAYHPVVRFDPVKRCEVLVPVAGAATARPR